MYNVIRKWLRQQPRQQWVTRATFGIGLILLLGLGAFVSRFAPLITQRQPVRSGLSLAASGDGSGAVTVAPLRGPAIQGPVTSEPIHPVVLNIDLSKLPYERPVVKEVRPE